jgi:hypothetical protein
VEELAQAEVAERAREAAFLMRNAIARVRRMRGRRFAGERERRGSR